jgi:chemotaxis family two-component system response regulator Rcp1
MSAPLSCDPVEILLVEDSPSDAELMIEALGESELSLRVNLIEDGEQAIHYLRRQGRYREALPPDLILLDLHLPRKNGHEVLAEVKRDDDLRVIPVVIMTSSDNDRAINAAYDLHANCCVCKPANQDEFRAVVWKIERFWLTFAQRARGG